MTTSKALIQDQLTAQLFAHTLTGLKPQTVIARQEERLIITVEPGLSVTVTTSAGRPHSHLHSLTKEKDGTLTAGHSWTPAPHGHLNWTLRNSSGVSKGIDKSVVQSGRDFPYIRVGGGQ